MMYTNIRFKNPIMIRNLSRHDPAFSSFPNEKICFAPRPVYIYVTHPGVETRRSLTIITYIHFLDRRYTSCNLFWRCPLFGTRSAPSAGPPGSSSGLKLSFDLGCVENVNKKTKEHQLPLRSVNKTIRRSTWFVHVFVGFSILTVVKTDGFFLCFYNLYAFVRCVRAVSRF